MEQAREDLSWPPLDVSPSLGHAKRPPPAKRSALTESLFEKQATQLLLNPTYGCARIISALTLAGCNRSC